MQSLKQSFKTITGLTVVGKRVARVATWVKLIGEKFEKLAIELILWLGQIARLRNYVFKTVAEIQ